MLIQACSCSRAPSGSTVHSFWKSSSTTVLGAASMVSGTMPVRTTNSQTAKNPATLTTGSIFKASGVWTLISR